MSSSLAQNKPQSLIGKAFWMLRKRPAHVLRAARGVLLFYGAAYVRRVLSPPGVVFGKNVRLQKNRCVMAEAPHARIVLGDDSIIYEKAKLEAYQQGQIEIGAQSVLGDIQIISRYRIQIGKRFLSSWNVFIEDFDPHPVDAELRRLQVLDIVQSFKPRLDSLQCNPETEKWQSKGWNFPGEEIVIGDDVWVGANATILKGAKIGNGCIVASGAVVLRGEYPAQSVIAGNPAKVVKVLSVS